MFERVKTLRFQNALSGLAVALVLVTGCSNVLRSGLVRDIPFSYRPVPPVPFMSKSATHLKIKPPLLVISARLSSKGYSVVEDSVEAAYLLHTQVVYCHKAGDGVRPETVAKSGFGAGIGRGGTPLGDGNDVVGVLNAQALRAMAKGRRRDAGRQCHDADGHERTRGLSGNGATVTER
jgi:hypothetical protein